MSIVMAMLLTAQAAAVPPASIPSTAQATPKPSGWNGDAASLATGERGRLLYAYDQAAWHGTDDLLANHKDAAPRQHGGYVVDGPVEAPRIAFFDATTHRAVYRARLVEGRIVDGRVATGAEAELTPMEQRLIAAREAARGAVLLDVTARPCAAKPFNTVVVPPSTPDGPIAVYLLTPQTTNDAVPLGGHYRIDVDAAGKAGPVQRFTHACLATPVHPALPNGAKPVGIVVGQLIGDRPTEIHVFTSLTVRQPIYVTTESGAAASLWLVSGSRIGGPRPFAARAGTKPSGDQ